MRHKLRLLNLILIVVFIFSFTACTTPKTATETTTAETTTVEINTQTEETETTTTTIDNSSVKYELKEAQRKQAFYELVVYQDSISINDLQRNEKMKEAYLIIAKKYDITEDEMKQIGVEGIEKNWPMPPLE